MLGSSIYILKFQASFNVFFVDINSILLDPELDRKWYLGIMKGLHCEFDRWNISRSQKL